MKTLLVGVAAIALIAAAAPVSAQMYQTTAPPAMSMNPTWMTDDGSSSDYPVHNPGDISGERLNRNYSGGIYTAPGMGFPAYPGQQ
ncbi:MAG TPA: hypothetical protein VG651_12875 [Stellaceae bacterium]|nr:hypothetical protein [Stellaceae bacterium]